MEKGKQTGKPEETKEELLDIAMILCDVWMEKVFGEVVRERTAA